jgi:hypothetical protein
MAELSHQDKVTLLGRNYKDNEIPEVDLRKTPAALARDERLKKLTYYRNTAATVAGLAAIIMISNYKEASGPYQPNLELAAGVTLAVCVLAAAAIHFVRKSA